MAVSLADDLSILLRWALCALAWLCLRVKYGSLYINVLMTTSRR